MTHFARECLCRQGGPDLLATDQTDRRAFGNSRAGWVHSTRKSMAWAYRTWAVQDIEARCADADALADRSRSVRSRRLPVGQDGGPPWLSSARTSGSARGRDQGHTPRAALEHPDARTRATTVGGRCAGPSRLRGPHDLARQRDGPRWWRRRDAPDAAGYGRGAQIENRWLVLDGEPEFFTITKRLHNLLHGDPGDGGPTRCGRARLLRAGPRQPTSPRCSHLVDAARHRAAPRSADRGHGRRPPRGWGPRRVALSRRARHEQRRDRRGVGVPHGPTSIAPTPSCSPARSTCRTGWTRTDSSSSRRRSTRSRPRTASWTRERSARSSPPSGWSPAPIRTVRSTSNAATAPRAPSGPTCDLIADGPPPPHDARLIVQVSRWDRLKDMAGVLTGFVTDGRRRPRRRPPHARRARRVRRDRRPRGRRGARRVPGPVAEPCPSPSAGGSTSPPSRWMTSTRTPSSSTPCSATPTWSCRRASSRGSG